MKTLMIALTLLAQTAAGSTGAATDYIVGPQDVLEIIVHGQDAFSTPRVVVDHDGTIAFPELGRVEVAGKSPRQIEENLKKTLIEKQILTKPSMTVWGTKRMYRPSLSRPKPTWSTPVTTVAAKR